MADVTWNGQLAKQIAKAAAMSALRDGAEAILTESQDEVPHATGTLMRSGTVTEAPTEQAVYISYNTPYAVKMHEDLTLRHPDPKNPISSTGRNAKYLENPFNRNINKVLKLVERRVKNALQSRQ